jgi:hypothetical protein
MSNGDRRHDESRRQFVKKAAYIAPAIVTLRAVPSLASSGSAWNKDAREAAKQAKEAAKEAAKQAKEAAKEAAKQAKEAEKQARKST